MNDFDKKLRIVESHVISIFQKNQFPALLYHKPFHTQEVAFHARELASWYHLSPEDTFAVVTAAWFHDTGHLFSVLKGHEEVGWKIAEENLLPLNIDESTLMKVRACILVTKMPVHPVQQIEQIICDADTYHLGTDSFLKTDKLVREEMQIRTHFDISSWDSHTLQFLKMHQFYTDYCRKKLNVQKEINIRLIEERIAKKE